MVFIFPFGCHLASVTLYLFKLSTLGRACKANSALSYAWSKSVNFSRLWMYTSKMQSKRWLLNKGDCWINTRKTTKTNITPSRPWTAQGWRLFYSSIFCCIPSDWREGSGVIKNCNSHLKHASICHNGSSEKRICSTSLRAGPCQVLSWHKTVSFWDFFLCYTEYVILDTSYLYVCVTRTLFCSVAFSSPWALIIIPTRENFSVLHRPGWKHRSASFLKAEKQVSEARTMHHILKSIVHFPMKKILHVGRKCPKEALLAKAISSSPSCTCHHTLYTIFDHLSSLFCGLLSPFRYILLSIQRVFHGLQVNIRPFGLF